MYNRIARRHVDADLVSNCTLGANDDVEGCVNDKSDYVLFVSFPIVFTIDIFTLLIKSKREKI